MPKEKVMKEKVTLYAREQLPEITDVLVPQPCTFPA